MITGVIPTLPDKERFRGKNHLIGAPPAEANHGGEICRGGGKFHRLLHASARRLKSEETGGEMGGGGAKFYRL